MKGLPPAGTRSSTTSNYFPNISPSRRRITYGDYVVNRFGEDQEITMPLPSTAQKCDVTMELVYANRHDEIARMFMDHYDQCSGEFYDFPIAPIDNTNGTFAGWDDPTTRHIRKGRWIYARPPRIEQTAINHSTTTIQIINLNPKLADPGAPEGPQGPDGFVPIPSPGPGKPAPTPEPEPKPGIGVRGAINIGFQTAAFWWDRQNCYGEDKFYPGGFYNSNSAPNSSGKNLTYDGTLIDYEINLQASWNWRVSNSCTSTNSTSNGTIREIIPAKDYFFWTITYIDHDDGDTVKVEQWNAPYGTKYVESQSLKYISAAIGYLFSFKCGLGNTDDDVVTIIDKPPLTADGVRTIGFQQVIDNGFAGPGPYL